MTLLGRPRNKWQGSYIYLEYKKMVQLKGVDHIGKHYVLPWFHFEQLPRNWIHSYCGVHVTGWHNQIPQQTL